MSNFAVRERRTVPLDDVEDEGDNSISLTDAMPYTQSPSRSRRKRLDGSISSRRLEPIRQSFFNSGNKSETGHSRESSMSLSTEELKKSLRQKAARNSHASAPKTPTQRSGKFTIGNSSLVSNSRNIMDSARPPPLASNSSGSVSSSSSRRSSSRPSSSRRRPMSGLSDLVSLEQALKDGRGGDLQSFVDGRELRRQNSVPETPVGWKTPFEVDAPRDAPTRSFSAVSPGPSPLNNNSSSDSDGQWTKEQDAWKGIDELLETQSMADSFCMSTADILPQSTVRAMRFEQSVGSFGETVNQSDDDDDHYDQDDDFLSPRSTKGPLALAGKHSTRSSRSKSSSGSSRRSSGSTVDSKTKGKSRHSKSSHRDDKGKEGRRDKGNESSLRQNQRNARSHLEEKREAGNPSNGALFDVFHWSEKDNVDEQRGKKTKLNRKPRRVQLMTGSTHGKPSNGSRSNHKSSLHRVSMHGNSNHSDTCSLPSLASFQPEEIPSKSDHWGGDTDHSSDFSVYGSVVSEDSGVEFSFDLDRMDIAHKPSKAPPQKAEPIVFDEGVEKYIQQIQEKLPTIVEDDCSLLKRGNNDKHQVEALGGSGSSPTSVMEDNALDELPTLASMSTHKRSSDFSSDFEGDSKAGGHRPEEKKEPKQRISSNLISSIKKIRKPKPQKGLANGDDAKYFPKEAKPKFGANRCLLAEGDDEAYWD